MINENAIKWLENLKQDIGQLRHEDLWHYEQAIAEIIAMLKDLEAKPPIHVHQEYPEHDWKTYEDGKIDEFAWGHEYCNGPMCKRCYYTFCIHCKPNGYDKKPCIIDFYKCPGCGERISKNIKFCDNCGQEIKWND